MRAKGCSPDLTVLGRKAETCDWRHAATGRAAVVLTMIEANRVEFAMAALLIDTREYVISRDLGGKGKFGAGSLDYSEVLAYAENIIRELKQSGNYDGRRGLVIVKDEAGNRIASLPFSPAVC